MSKEIDERVVSMQFDNRQFEANVKHTMTTLERLKQSLQFKGGTKGFEEVNSAAKKVDMTHLGKGLEMCRERFSALEIMGVTALANITNSAVNAGKRMVHALTLEPVMTGFSEYETKINSIQTIMSNTASKGTTMEDVTRVINELNTYADKTIYNFAEMTRNIGTFTAAGVGLEESAAAIQGIANLAAASGSSSQQASTAMYQLSQALAAGTVKLMDWNSVVNAGMGGEKFQEALKATAREHGIAVDSIIKKNGSFRESLQDGWISADILNETLNKFTVEGAKNYAESMLKAGKYTQEQADALVAEAQAMEDAATKVKTFTQLFDTMKESVQSGWAQTWELIVGDFEEAKDFLSKLSTTFGKVIDGISNARNKILGAGLSPWKRLTEQIDTAGQSSEKFQELVKSAAKDAGIPIDKLIKQYGSLTKVINAGKIPAKVFSTALKKLIGVETETTKSTKDLGDVVKKVLNGEFGVGEERVKKLTEAGYDYAAVQNKVNEALGSSVRHTTKLTDEQLKNADSLVKLSDKQLKNKGYTDEQIKALRELEKAAEGSGGSIQDLIDSLDKPSGRTLLLDSIQNVLKAIGKILGAIKKAWQETFDPITGDHVYGFVEGLNKLTESMIISDETAENFQRVMEGLFSAFKLATGVISKGLITGIKLVSAVLSLFGTNLLEVAAFLADYIVKFREWVEEHTMFIGTIDKLAKIIKAFIDGIRSCAKAFMQLEVVSKTIEKFKKIFTDTFGNLSFGFDKFNIDGAVEAIQKAFERIRKWIEGLSDSENIGQDIINGIVKGLKIGISKLASAVINVATTIIDTICGVLGIQSPSTVMITVGKFLISGLILGIIGQKTFLFDGIKNMCIGLYLLIKNNIGKVVDWLKNIDWPEIKMEHILGVGVITALVLTVKKILDIMDTFAGAADGFGNMCDGAGKVMSAFAERINPSKSKFQQFADALFRMSTAIIVLAGAIYILAQLDSTKMWNAVGAIAALTLLLTGLTLASAKLEKAGGNLGKTTTLLVGLAASLFIMASAIKKLEFLDMYNVGPILTGFVGIVGSMILLMYALDKVNGLEKSVTKSSGTILKISFTMMVLSWAIKSVSKLQPEPLKQGIITLGIFGAFITALLFATKLAGPSIDGAGSTILKISLAIATLVGVIKLISWIDPIDMAKGIDGIKSFIGIIAALMAATQLAKGGINGVGSTLIGISTAMMLMTLTVKMVAGLSEEDMKKGLTCITIFGSIIVGLIYAVSLIQNDIKGVTGTLLAVSVVIGVLAAVSIVLSMVSLEGLAKGVTAVSILCGMVALIIKEMNGIEKAKGSITAMTICIGLLVGAVVGLSFMDPEELARSVAAVTILLGMFALLMKSSQYVKGGKEMYASLGVMAGVIIVLGGVVVGLSHLTKADTAIQSVGALSILLVSLATAMRILDKVVNVDKKLIGNVALMGLVIGELAVILGIMSALNVEASIPSAIALSVLLNAMAAAMIVLDHVGLVSNGIIGTMTLLGLVVGELAVILGAMSTLNVEASIPSAIALSVLLNAMASAMLILNGAIFVTTSSVAKMLLLGLVVGELGAILGAMSYLGVEASIPTAIALSTLLLAMSKALTILGAVGLMGSASFIGIGALATMITGIGGLIVGIGALVKKFPQLETFLNTGIPILEKIGYALGSFFGNIIGGFTSGAFSGFPQIGQMLSDFMTNATPFFDGIKMVGKDTLEGAKALAQTIIVLTAADIMSGIASFFGVGDGIASFGTQLGQLGTGLRGFLDKLGVLDKKEVNTVSCASEALKTLAVAAGKIPNEGGLWGSIVGENGIASFASALPNLGSHLSTFVTNLGTFTDKQVKTVECAGNAIIHIANAAKKIPNDGGWIGAIFGENSISSFSSKLPGLGTHLQQFVTNLGTFTEAQVTTVQCAANAVKEMAIAADKIPNDGGWIGKLCGENSLATFGKYLPGLASNLKTFVSNLGTFTDEQVTTVRSAVSAINAFARLGSVDLKAATENLPNFGTEMTSFAETLKSFVTKMSEISSDDLSNVKSQFSKIIALMSTIASTNVGSLSTFGDSLVSLAEDAVDKFVGAFNGDAPVSRVKKGARALVTAAISAIKEVKDKFEPAGKSVITPFINGMKDKTKAVKSAAKSVAKSGAGTAGAKSQEVYDAYKGAGKYCVQGFAAGIKANQFMAKASAKAMAKAALRAAEEALDENSPSKEFYRVGDFGGQGFVNAFIDYSSKAFNAGKNMAEYATKGLSAAVAKISNIINGDMDLQPTITPVLDLNGVTAGASAISRMLDMNPRVGVLSDVRSISSMMNNRNQNGNSDVVSAVKKLGTKLDNISGDTYIVDGVTYDDGSNVTEAVKTLVRAAKIERRR